MLRDCLRCGGEPRTAKIGLDHSTNRPSATNRLSLRLNGLADARFPSRASDASGAQLGVGSFDLGGGKVFRGRDQQKSLIRSNQTGAFSRFLLSLGRSGRL
jgi:hypothetical protein